MPNPTPAGRRVAWFEDGELWCADDATPPVSPAGWYLRPRGTTVPWIGPFATTAEAQAAPGGGDPFAAARQRLDAWAARGGSAAAPREAPTGAAAVRSERGHRRPAASPAPGGGPSGPADEERAGARPRRTRPPSRQDRGEPGLPGRERGRAGGTPRPPDVPAAPSRAGGDARPPRRKRSARRRGRAPGVQAALPF